jgi:CheY-like chemotaxis protein
MSDQSRLDGVRVLVVDDTRSVLDVVTDMLKHNGAEVTWANRSV